MSIVAASVFVEFRFWLLVGLSLFAPVAIYAFLRSTRSIRRSTVTALGLCLVAIAGLDVYLLQTLATLARRSASVHDDAVFASEVSIALYVLPIFFGGVGVNLVSHALVAHLLDAEKAAYGQRCAGSKRIRRTLTSVPAPVISSERGG